MATKTFERVCFHDRTSCPFCPTRPRRKVRSRCACCGRFVKMSDREMCCRCQVRGFRALRLFA